LLHKLTSAPKVGQLGCGRAARMTKRLTHRSASFLAARPLIR
jgi:hypothetical protein